MHLIPATRADRRHRPRWVVAELDVHGEIDDHAAMCLQHAIEGACASGAVMIRVDLRDLTAIDAPRLRLFARANADCRSSGVQLGLLICGQEQHDAIAAAFNAAGLADQLQFTNEPRALRARQRSAARGWRARSDRHAPLVDHRARRSNSA